MKLSWIPTATGMFGSRQLDNWSVIWRKRTLESDWIVGQMLFDPVALWMLCVEIKPPLLSFLF